MQVYMVRHGQTDWNAAGLLQGSSDIPLNDVGRAQADATAQALAQVLPPHTTVVTSPLTRAYDTASTIATALETTAVVEEGFRERAYGEWEGLTLEERLAQWPNEVRQWQDNGHAGIPGFEAHSLVRDRVVAALEDWRDRTEGPLVVVTHGSAARMGLQGVLGLPLEVRTLGNLGNAAWSRLSRRARGEWTLERHNVSATPDVLAA